MGNDGVSLRTKCACGWEMTGGEDEVVAATIDHGRRVHNMTATREQVLETAEGLGPERPRPSTPVDRGGGRGGG
ncbi:MAG TPA: DUF1059 domain-containing protein [Candidatus Acidoferrum sp.]|nr:DUF1059 domain-containing protein [Candidatus Acidoferrum sp.]